MYRQCIPQVVLWGPTHFAPIIQKTSEHAQQAVAAGAGNVYYVLLILTDGAITDMPQTTNAIVAASHLPISIIIVGVGNADFSSMNILDGDGPDGPVRQPCPVPVPCPIATSLLPTGRERAVGGPWLVGCHTSGRTLYLNSVLLSTRRHPGWFCCFCSDVRPMMMTSSLCRLRSSRGEKAKRDIVQFVPINEFLQNPAGLAKEVLEEVPMQVCEYLKAHPMAGTSA